MDVMEQREALEAPDTAVSAIEATQAENVGRLAACTAALERAFAAADLVGAEAELAKLQFFEKLATEISDCLELRTKPEREKRGHMV